KMRAPSKRYAPGVLFASLRLGNSIGPHGEILSLSGHSLTESATGPIESSQRRSFGILDPAQPPRLSALPTSDGGSKAPAASRYCWRSFGAPRSQRCHTGQVIIKKAVMEKRL